MKWSPPRTTGVAPGCRDLVHGAAKLLFGAGPVEGVGVEVAEVEDLGASGAAHAVSSGDFDEVIA